MSYLSVRNLDKETPSSPQLLSANKDEWKKALEGWRNKEKDTKRKKNRVLFIIIPRAPGEVYGMLFSGREKDLKT